MYGSLIALKYLSALLIFGALCYAQISISETNNWPIDIDSKSLNDQFPTQNLLKDNLTLNRMTLANPL